MTATTTDVRAWARQNGYDIGGKGRIPSAVQEHYDREHDPAGVSSPDGDYTEPAGPDYDGGVSDLDFIAADEPPALEEPQDGPENAVAERRPRKVAKTRAAGKSFRERVWGGGKAGTRRPAKKHPRVSLKGFAEDVFLDLAWTFQGLPPMEKVLYLQAPLAGQIVEDTCKGTVADKVLQPVARVDRQFKALEALTAPAWVAAIMVKGRRSEDGEYSPETKLMFGGLRHALLSMTRATDMDFGELRGKADELKTRSGEIDEMIAWLFEMPAPPEMTEEQAQAAAAAARAGANGQ